MGASISIESPLQDDVQALIKALNAHLEPLSPLEHQYKMSANELAQDNAIVFVARNQRKKAIGLGALKLHGDDVGEVKRMFTSPMVRGQGIGTALLQAISAQAALLKVKHLVLETGKGKGYAPAWQLYQRSGFVRCGPVLDYLDTGSSAFFEKQIDG